MEQQMKISAALVRNLRTARGWSQDQLATAAGLSLRTIQRVEAEGVASMGTRVSLAATFGVALAELGDEPAVAPMTAPRPSHFSRLLFGLAVLSCVMLIESMRQVFGGPLARGTLAIELLLAAVGAWLLVPAALQLLRRRCFAGVLLASLGMPLAMLLLVGLCYGALSARAPGWSLLALGAGGLLLVAMAWRDCAQLLRS